MALTDRRNILLLCSDMAGAHHFGCYDPGITYTPHVDSIAAEGALFERAYCSCPPCIPTRVSLFSGQYGHTHGKMAHLKMELAPEPPILPQILKEAGYRTAIAGKTHWWPSGSDFGCEKAYITIDNHLTPELGRKDAYIRFLESRNLFQYSPETWAEDKKRLDPNELPFECLKANWLGETTCNIIRQFAGGDKPFFIFCSFVEPHGPGKAPRWYVDKMRSVYTPPMIPLEAGQETKPYTQKKAVQRWRKPPEEIEQERLEVFAGIKLVDENIGRILSQLEAQGCADSTLVVFLTDHGDLLYDHGCIEKTFLYEQAVRIPFLLKGPGIPQGCRYSDPVSQIDLLPTILDYTGIDESPEWNIEGRSTMPLLQGERVRWRDTLFCETEQSVHLKDLVSSSSAKMAIQWPWKYIYTLIDGHIVEEELYNLSLDPRELDNRAQDPEQSDRTGRLRNEILRWLVATEANRLHPVPENHYPVPRVERKYV